MKKNSGCGKIYIDTKFGIDCNNGKCNGPNSVRRVRVFYAVYSFQPGESTGRYKRLFTGSAEPAVINCERGQYLSGVEAKYGSTAINCVALGTMRGKKAKKADDGNMGNRGPRGEPNYEQGPRGPSGPDETRYR